MSAVDLGRFLDDDELVISGVKSQKYPSGHTYRIASPDAETGLWLSGLASVGARVARGDADVTEDQVLSLKMNDKAEADFITVILGPTYQELIDDGVSWVAIQRISQYAFTHFAISPQAATEGVKSGAFKGKARKTGQGKTSTGAKSRKSPASAGSKKTPRPAG